MSKKKSANGPLVWIDLEMTGLDSAVDTILEVAVIVTDNNLGLIASLQPIVIHHDVEALEAMNPWCREYHGKSGLTREALESTTSIKEAEQRLVAFLDPLVKKGEGVLSGNTIWQDRLFIQKYMPKVAEFFHYRMIDVSSVKELIQRWYPQDSMVAFKKSDQHRASKDIQESIDELAWYKSHFFK